MRRACVHRKAISEMLQRMIQTMRAIDSRSLNTLVHVQFVSWENRCQKMKRTLLQYENTEMTLCGDDVLLQLLRFIDACFVFAFHPVMLILFLFAAELSSYPLSPDAAVVFPFFVDDLDLLCCHSGFPALANRFG